MALGTLALAIDRDAQWRERARSSDAFSSLAADAEFQRLVGP